MAIISDTQKRTLHALLNAQKRLDAEATERTNQARNGYANTVRLARHYGMPWADIATHLDTTPEAARKRYERGL